MMLKHARIALILLIVSLPALFSGIYHNNQSLYALSRGNYFFDKTRNNLNIHKLIIKDKNNIVTLVNNNNLWRINELDDYYASFVKINSLVSLISNSTIYRADKKASNEYAKVKNALEIITVTDEGTHIDSVQILPKSANNKYHYALKNDDKFIYQINGDFALSTHPMDWAQLPLLTINYEKIKRISSDNFEIYRSYTSDEFKSIKNDNPILQPRSLTDALWYINADEIKHSVHFSNKDAQKIKHFDITMFNGLIYRLDILKTHEDYWLTITQDHTKIFAPNVLKTIENNKILYEGWFFKIDRDKGAIISAFSY